MSDTEREIISLLNKLMGNSFDRQLYAPRIKMLFDILEDFRKPQQIGEIPEGLVAKGAPK